MSRVITREVVQGLYKHTGTARLEVAVAAPFRVDDMSLIHI